MERRRLITEWQESGTEARPKGVNYRNRWLFLGGVVCVLGGVVCEIENLSPDYIA